MPVSCRRDLNNQLPAIEHGLASVDDNVEDRLLQQICIGQDVDRLGAIASDDLDSLSARIRGKRDNFTDQHVGIDSVSGQFNRPGEVEQGLDDTVKPVNLIGQDLDMRTRVKPGIELGIDQFQMQHQRVERVLDPEQRRRVILLSWNWRAAKSTNVSICLLSLRVSRAPAGRP